ncbi:MAG: translocation/assembly module TamB domain-containing protein, partial [Ignavibacteria bacterium]
SFLYNNMFLKSFKGSANASMIDSVLSSSYNLLLNEVKYGDVNLRYIETAGVYKNRQLNSELNLVYSDSLSVHTKSSVIFDSAIYITIPELSINSGGDSLLNRKGPVELAVSNNSYSIKNFNLQNDTGYILIDAEMTNEKYLNADVSIHSVEINKFFPGDEFYGLVNLDLKAGGNIGNPAAEGDLEITGLTIDSIETGNLTARVKLKDKILDWNLTSVQPGGNKLKCSGFIPINLPPDDSSSFINEEKEFEVNISIDNYDLANADFISNYFDKIEGKINGEIYLKNNLKDPRLDGTLEISASNLKKDKMGIDYRNIKIKLEADPDKIWIDTAYIISSIGNITVSGFVGSKTNILTGEPDNVNLNLYSSDFEIIKGKENNVLLDGSLHLYSEKGSTRFDGDFIIPRSSIFLPSLTKTKTTDKGDEPFLVQAVLPGDRNKIKDIDTVGYSIPELNPVKDINGIIKIRIPDNTWVKSSNVNIELNGDLIIEKTGEDIVLKGKIKTGRGYLYFYGKKFNVTKGELVFNGEKPINPFIDATIEYNFRSPTKEKEKIEISVTNTINDPRITYTHDDEIINEGDAVSYIVFGTKMENLTQSQQSEMSGNQNVVSDAVTGMLASSLSSHVGRKIGLDVFEISGEDNWQSAYLTAGKYATDDLYISYKHGVPIGNSSETEIKTLNVEYEILDFLFIQVIGGNSEESGVNIIIKLD